MHTITHMEEMTASLIGIKLTAIANLLHFLYKLLYRPVRYSLILRTMKQGHWRKAGSNVMCRRQVTNICTITKQLGKPTVLEQIDWCRPHNYRIRRRTDAQILVLFLKAFKHSRAYGQMTAGRPSRHNYLVRGNAKFCGMNTYPSNS